MTDGCTLSQAVPKALRAGVGSAKRVLAHATQSAIAALRTRGSASSLIGDASDRIEQHLALSSMARDYETLRPKLSALRAAVPTVATWDDHDYGQNDAGAEWALRADARRLFCTFWFGVAGCPNEEALQATEEAGDVEEEGGVYSAHSFMIGRGRWVQLILLDTRSHRSPWRRRADRAAAGADDASTAAAYDGAYEPHDASYHGGDGGPRMLDERQWAWLAAQLRECTPDGGAFTLRLIASSTQVLRSPNGQEAWENMPGEAARLRDVIARTYATRVVLISGDVHYAEVSDQSAEHRSTCRHSRRKACSTHFLCFS
jgi:alkaline phosphatase D